MLDDDTQRELLRDTVEPEKALSVAVNMEIGQQNQQKFSFNNNGVNNSPQQNRANFNRESTGFCWGCG